MKEGGRDTRPFDKRPLGSVLLDFFRQAVQRRKDLEETVAQEGFSVEDRQELRELSQMLDRHDPPPTLLARFDRVGQPFYTGDDIVDELIAKLEAGEVPADFWGEKGPPEDPEQYTDVKTGEKFAKDDVADWWKV